MGGRCAGRVVLTGDGAARRGQERGWNRSIKVERDGFDLIGESFPLLREWTGQVIGAQEGCW